LYGPIYQSKIVAYDIRPHDWSIRSNSEAKKTQKRKKDVNMQNVSKVFHEKRTFLLRKKLSFKCLVLCKSYQLVVYVTINYSKSIMLERENILLILKIGDDSPNVKSF
jgi:hypothetical protein